jgi:hypothetical protein
LDSQVIAGTLPIPGIHFPEATAPADAPDWSSELVETVTRPTGHTHVVGHSSLPTFAATLSDWDRVILVWLPVAEHIFWRPDTLALSFEDERPDVLLRELKDLTGLPMEGLAKAIGVSRRTTYKWVQTRQAKPEHRTKLLELAEVFRPLSLWSRLRIQTWLRSGERSPLESLSKGDISAVRTAVAKALTSPNPPIRHARRARVGQLEADSVDSLTPMEVMRAFASLSTSRPARASHSWQPRELSDTDEADDSAASH